MPSQDKTGILVITGGSRGIGFATVKAFIAQGWTVINLSRTPCVWPEVINIIMDLTLLGQSQSPEGFPPVWQSLFYEKKRVVLVHNAGMFVPDTVSALSVATTRVLFEVNVFAPMVLNEALIPFMAEGSAIIYIGSTLSEKGVPETASYTSSKHAVVGLMKATCQDLAKTGIHTCCICPGITETEMLKTRCENNPHLFETLSSLSTYGRLVQPEELAELIWFCAQHPVINGAVIHGHLGQIER